MMTTERFSHYKVGIPAMDDDHWQLMLQLNHIVCRIKDGLPIHEEVAAARDSLVTHLKAEENAMYEASYPYVAHHLIEHINILRMFDQLITHIDNSTPTTISHKYTIETLESVFETHSRSLRYPVC